MTVARQARRGRSSPWITSKSNITDWSRGGLGKTSARATSSSREIWSSHCERISAAQKRQWPCSSWNRGTVHSGTLGWWTYQLRMGTGSWSSSPSMRSSSKKTWNRSWMDWGASCKKGPTGGSWGGAPVCPSWGRCCNGNIRSSAFRWVRGFLNRRPLHGLSVHVESDDSWISKLRRVQSSSRPSATETFGLNFTCRLLPKAGREVERSTSWWVLGCKVPRSKDRQRARNEACHAVVNEGSWRIECVQAKTAAWLTSGATRPTQGLSEADVTCGPSQKAPRVQAWMALHLRHRWSSPKARTDVAVWQM